MIEQIKRQSLAQYIGGEQERAGRAIRINPCPLCGHRDCFTVFESNTYHCYSCGKGGSIIDYVLDKGMAGDVSSAVDLLGKHFNISRDVQGSRGKDSKPQDGAFTGKRQDDASTVKRAEIERVFNLAAEFYHQQLMATKAALAYMHDKRGREDEILRELKIGFAPTRYCLSSHFKDKKIPVEVQIASGLVLKGEDGKLYDLFGGQVIYPGYVGSQVCDFQGKPIDKEKGKVCQLRGDNKLRGCLFYGQDGMYRDEWILVEGPEDRNSILQQNLKYNAIAILGSLSEAQVKMLSERCDGKKVYLCFDNDQTGEKYTKRLISELSGLAQVFVIEFPKEYKDIDEYLRRGSEGQDAFRGLLESALDPVSWFLRQIPEGELNPYQTKLVLQPIIEIIAREKDSFMRSAYISQVEKYLKPRPKIISAITRAVRETISNEGKEAALDPEEDFERSVSRKGTQYVKITKDSYKVISDFVMEIVRYIEDDGVRYYEVVLRTSGGSSSLTLSNEQRINMRLFDAALAGVGPYYFYGSLNDLKEVWQLEEERADIKNYTCRFNRFGWIKDHNVWLFSNCAYKGGKLYLPEPEQDVIVIDGIGYQSKQVRVYGGDVPSLETSGTPRQEYVHQVIERVWDMWDADAQGERRGFKGYMAMGFLAATVYLTEITSKENKFPYLLAFGPPGTGKSEAMQFIMNMWGFRNGGENWGEATPSGIGMALEQLSGIPYWLEEFSNTMGASTLQQRKVELLKNAYNRVGSGKGGLQGRTIYEVNGSIFLTGQDRPENQALLSRCVVLRKEKPTEAGTSGYYYLKAEGKKLTQVIRWLLETKTAAKAAEYWENYTRLMDELKSRVKSKAGDYNERTAVNYAIIATGFSMYDYHEHDQEFLDWLVSECVTDMNRKQAEDIVYRFFSDIETIFHNELKSVVVRTEKEVYLYYTHIYNEWIKNQKLTGMQEYIGREGLLDYMRKDTNDYWISPKEKEGMHRKYFQNTQARCIGVYIDRLPKPIKDVVEGWDIPVNAV